MAQDDHELRDAAVELARRPALWPAALGAAARHLPDGWWRSPEAVRAAVPWLRFRLETAYGSERTTPTSDDVVTYLAWLRSWPRRRR